MGEILQENSGGNTSGEQRRKYFGGTAGEILQENSGANTFSTQENNGANTLSYNNYL